MVMRSRNVWFKMRYHRLANAIMVRFHLIGLGSAGAAYQPTSTQRRKRQSLILS
jgi:hypothetical protein